MRLTQSSVPQLMVTVDCLLQCSRQSLPPSPKLSSCTRLHFSLLFRTTSSEKLAHKHPLFEGTFFTLTTYPLIPSFPPFPSHELAPSSIFSSSPPLCWRTPSTPPPPQLPHPACISPQASWMWALLIWNLVNQSIMNFQTSVANELSVTRIARDIYCAD